jgi:threonine/homoserine/homoserine lactone efflux protein
MSFFLASALLASVPGAGMLYAAAQTMTLGRRAGWYSALGLHLAGVCHVVVAALGVSVLLQLGSAAFLAMKTVGAIYLIWLGLRYLMGYVPLPDASRAASAFPARKALRDSFLIGMLEPQSVLFFFAFLPQFTDPTANLPVWLQILILGMIVNVMFSISDAVLIELSNMALRAFKRSTRLMRLLQRVSGGVLVALGLKLALSR